MCKLPSSMARLAKLKEFLQSIVTSLVHLFVPVVLRLQPEALGMPGELSATRPHAQPLFILRWRFTKFFKLTLHSLCSPSRPGMNL